MDGVLCTGQALAHWIDANGYRSVGFSREFCSEYGCGEPAGWVTEPPEPAGPYAGTYRDVIQNREAGHWPGR